MAIIYSYPKNTDILSTDVIVGTSTRVVNGKRKNVTKNFEVSSIAEFYNETSSIAITGQNNFFFQNNIALGRKSGSISFIGGGGSGTNFSSITTIRISKKATSGNLVIDYINTFVDQAIIIAQVDNLNNFGIYKFISITQSITEPDFYDIVIEMVNANGSIQEDKFYGFAIYPGFINQNITPIQNITETSQLINDGENGTSVYVEADELGDTAFSNDYNDLDNLPTIPTKTSDLVNDGEDGINPFITLADIPPVDISSKLDKNFSLFADKTTPVDTDLLVIYDGNNKKVTFSNLKATLKTYFDTIYTTTSAVATQITTALIGYATESWVTSQGYITNVITALGYTPENVANKATDLTSPDNTKYPTTLVVSNALSGKQDSLGFTPENVANKSTNTSLGTSDTLYPTQNAVKVYADSKVTDAIVDGVTTVAPSQNAVFDALALKQNTLTNPITGTGANGQVAFFNGTTTQTGDNGLFWDNTNKRLGVGTNLPTHRLSVDGDLKVKSNSVISAGFNTNRTALISIGTSADGAFFDLYSNVGLAGTQDLGYAIFAKGLPSNLTNSEVLEFRYDRNARRYSMNSIAYGTGTLLPISLYTGTNTNQLVLNTNGNVSVGASTAGARLDVRAQGALSTDIAFRVRNSADTADLLNINGLGVLSISSIASDITINGVRAGRGNGNRTFNTAFGFEALNSNSAAAFDRNTAIGYQSMKNNVTGSNNTAIGSEALSNLISGLYNTAAGTFSLNSNTGSANTAIGWNSLARNTSGSNNVVIGYDSARFIADGITNNTISNNCIFIGSLTRPLANNQSNQIVIGDSAIGLGSNTIVLGNDSIVTTALKGNVTIGATTAGARLDVRAQGALSTDIAFRVRNSADTLDTVQVRGDGVTNFNLATGQSISLTHAGGTRLNLDGISVAYRTGSRIILGGVNDFLDFSTVNSTRMTVNNLGNVLIGTTTDTASAILNVSSTTKGFLPPRMTNAQRLAIASPAVGLMVYCTDATEGLYINKSTGWTFII